LNDKPQSKYTYKFHVNNPQENQEWILELLVPL
jgi:hypothetical protein